MLNSTNRISLYKAKGKSTFNETDAKIKQSNSTHTKSFNSTLDSTGFREQALSTMKIALNNVHNVRYLGHTEYQSPNSLQNSSFCYSFSKQHRFITHNTITDKMYTLPQVISFRRASMGLGSRKDRRPKVGQCSPLSDSYTIQSCFDSNISHKRGSTFGDRLEKVIDPDRVLPGPGAYTVTKQGDKRMIPIKIKSRQGFFYEDEFKKRMHCVSMQKYHPNDKLEQNQRFNRITFGIGDRSPNVNIYVKTFPGPGAYNIESSFDKGKNKRTALN